MQSWKTWMKKVTTTLQKAELVKAEGVQVNEGVVVWLHESDQDTRIGA